MKDPTIFQGEIIIKLQKIHGHILKIFHSRNSVLISTKLGTNYSSVNENAVDSNEGPHPFPGGDDYEIVKILWQILTKLGKNHPWVKGIQDCSNEGPRPFPRGNNYEIVKIHWRILKIFFSRYTGSILTKLSRNHPWVKETQVCSKEGPRLFQ